MTKIEKSGVPCDELLLMVTSYIITAQYQPQQCDIATMCMYHAMSFNHMSESGTVSYSALPDSETP